jgi:hypothetical protein
MSRKSSFVGKANNSNQIDESSKDFKVHIHIIPTDVHGCSRVMARRRLRRDPRKNNRQDPIPVAEHEPADRGQTGKILLIKRSWRN